LTTSASLAVDASVVRAASLAIVASLATDDFFVILGLLLQNIQVKIATTKVKASHQQMMSLPT
jgi:hypothetical protein